MHCVGRVLLRGEQVPVDSDRSTSCADPQEVQKSSVEMVGLI